LTPNDQLEQQAINWSPINTTKKDYLPKQKKIKDKEDKEYTEIKNAIIASDISVAEKYLDIELKIMRKTLIPYIPKLKALGYKDLCWW